MVDACSFAGTGNVLKVQAMLHHCDEHIDTSEKKDKEEKREIEMSELKRIVSWWMYLDIE